MKISPVFSLRTLTSRIHHPLPLSPRESHKLLSVLNASFRQQLDQEHPETSSGHAHDAHRHLHSVLTNPLFNVKTRMRGLSPESHTEHDHGNPEDAQLFTRRPLDYFKENVAAGTATLDTAKQYLQAQYNIAVPSSDLEATSSLKSSAAGSAVLSWLWSSGLEGSDTILLDHEFVAVILPFLVAKRHQSIARRWLGRLQNTLDSEPAEAASDVAELRRSAANVLLQLVKSEIKYGGGLNAAMADFLCRTGDKPFAGPMHTDSLAQSHTCGPAGRYLVHVLAHRSAGTVPDVALYDDFVQSVGRWTTSNSVFTAILLLHHPVRPDCAPALRRLRCLSPETLLTGPPSKRRTIVQLCLDSAGFLLSQDRRVDAIWVMELAQKIYPEKFGTGQSAESPSSTASPEETSQAGDETSNIQLLEALATH